MVAASEPGSIIIDPAFESDAVYARPDVAFLRQHYSIVDRFGMRLNEDRGRLDCLACQYAESRGNIGAAEIEALTPLVPHLSQTLLLARTFCALKAQYRAVLTELDRVDVALFLCMDLRPPSSLWPIDCSTDQPIPKSPRFARSRLRQSRLRSDRCSRRRARETAASWSGGCSC